jgi:hypothetical protein
MFTFSDSSWDGDHDTARSTGRFLILHCTKVESRAWLDHPNNMPESIIDIIGAEAKYNEACIAMHHMYMSIDHIHYFLRSRRLIPGRKTHTLIDFYKDNIPYRLQTEAKHRLSARCTIWISNQSMVANMKKVTTQVRWIFCGKVQ